MASINDKELEKAGLDPKIIQKLANRIDNAARELQKLGVEIFGGFW